MKTRMRKRAREFPRITTNKNCYLSNHFKNNNRGLQACQYTGTKKYLDLQNEIVFVECGNITENDVLDLLIHEINHWAHDLYLADCEVNKRIESYSKQRELNKTPFTEWINTDAGYDMTEWEEKYRKRK